MWKSLLLEAARGVEWSYDLLILFSVGWGLDRLATVGAAGGWVFPVWIVIFRKWECLHFKGGHFLSLESLGENLPLVSPVMRFVVLAGPSEASMLRRKLRVVMHHTAAHGAIVRERGI